MREREKDSFLSGVLAALAVVSDAGADTIRDEIIATVGAGDLIRVARKTGSMRWSGMSRYLWEQKASGRADTVDDELRRLAVRCCVCGHPPMEHDGLCRADECWCDGYQERTPRCRREKAHGH